MPDYLFRCALCALLGFALIGCPEGDDDDNTPFTDDDDDSSGDDDDTTVFVEGCITINGELPGFANLQDAVFMAQEGDVISLCADTFVGSVTVDRSVSIVGAADGESIVEGDTNEMAITVTAADVSLTRFTVLSTRNAVVAEGASGLVLDHMTITDSGQFGVSLSNSAATIHGSVLSGHPFAAIDAQNSTLTMTSSELLDNEDYGLRLVSSTADVSDSRISGAAGSEDGDDYSGTCVFSEDSTAPIVMDNVQIDSCARVAVYWFYSDFEASGCSISNANYGFVGVGGGGDGTVLTDNHLQDMAYYGIYVIEQDSSVIGNTVSASNAVFQDSIGIAVGNTDGNFTVQDNTVQGYRLYSIWVQYPYDPTPEGGTAVVSGNTVLDGQMYGLYVSALDEVTFTDNVVDGLAWSGTQSVPNSYSSGMGIGLFDIGELTMSGNAARNVDVVGYFIQNTEFLSTDDEVTGTRMWAMYIDQSSGTFTGLDVHDLTIYGIDARVSDVDFEGCTFTDLLGGIQPAEEDDPGAYPYPTMGVVYNDAQGTVAGSSFTGIEDYGVYVQEGSVTVDGNSFDDNYTGVYVYQSTIAEGYPVYIENNTFGEHGYTAINAYTSDATIANNVFTSVEGYHFYGNTFWGTLEGNQFGVEGVDCGTCVYLYTYYSDEILGGLTVDDNVFYGCERGLYYYYVAGELTVSDNTFDGVQTGIETVDYNVDGAEVLILEDNEFVNVTGQAIDVEDVVTVELTGDNTVSGNGSGAAVQIEGSGTVVVDGLSVTGAAEAGLKITGTGSVSITNGSFTSSVDSGIHVDGSGLTLDLSDNTAVSLNGGNGIQLSGTVSGDMLGNVIEGNQEYGIACDSASVNLGNCFNSLSGNVMGDYLETNGCTLGCVAQ
jgi:hypothetical protein